MNYAGRKITLYRTHSQFLRKAHNESGQPGAKRAMAGIVKPVSSYYNRNITCQSSSHPSNSTVASYSQQTVATSSSQYSQGTNITYRGQYILVVQDYFSKRSFAKPLSDQKVDTTVQAFKDHVLVYHDSCTQIIEETLRSTL